jgi:acetyl-CoA carboxylase biotin carboxylase subunit
MFDTVLIANRGEIALRIARACRELGVRVAVVYSTEDADAQVVREADEAVRIGPGAARLSYLNIPAIIEAARRTGADAIHPGYGFLSENADFAEVCAAEGITFIGPPPEVTEALSTKSSCRSLMARAGLPLLPGSLDPVETAEEGLALAEQIGWPVAIKAVAGGGGRGIAVVREPAEFVAAYRATRRSAGTLFGDNRVYIERYLEAARHVEVQILADRYGNVIHLGERDCSVQRRYQKMVEEAPAPGLPSAMLARMAEHAVAGARAVGYLGAGTFEFLVDPAGEYYFMEVNCRIQVEHPVTEMVTGIDLVQEQLWVASGRALPYRQSDVSARGVAIECRINAEDPAAGFAPTPGRLDEFVVPAGPFVRVDTDGFPGSRVSAFYDPLLAKVCVWAPDRERALARMRRALGEVRIGGSGIRTNAGFLDAVLTSAPFRSASHDTALVSHLLHQPAQPKGERQPAYSQV